MNEWGDPMNEFSSLSEKFMIVYRKIELIKEPVNR